MLNLLYCAVLGYIMLRQIMHRLIQCNELYTELWNWLRSLKFGFRSRIYVFGLGYLSHTRAHSKYLSRHFTSVARSVQLFQVSKGQSYL
jgi:hypothetical protein